MAQPMRDPSDGIDPELISHVHLVSANPYPSQGRLEFQTITKYLLSAPQIAKDKAPFFWTVLDRPAPGTILMTWQPITKLSTKFASDGYVWAPEQIQRRDVGNGLMLEMCFSQKGYKHGDQLATYARRRFRLVPSQQGNPNTPQVDINLWIVHYAMADPSEQIPSTMLPFTPELQNEFGQRNYLQSCGSIARKDFMLSDRGNWPHIQWPRSALAGRQQMYAPMPPNRRVPQQVAYPPGGPQSGRRRTQTQAQTQHVALEAYDDDDKQKDVFDVLTPRDIALARYQQNHEWMEEVLSSPYSIYAISPPDLGLGFKGELKALTDGIFTAQGAEALEEYPEKPYTGKLDADLAAEFKKRAQEYIDSSNAEMEKLKADHVKAVASIKAITPLMQGEKDLRLSTEERGPEPWRLEGRTVEGEDRTTGSSWSQKHNKKVEDIVAQVEAQLGRQIAVLKDVSRIQDGGYQEPTPEPVKEPSPIPVQPPVDSESAGNGLSKEEALSRRPSQAGSQHSGVMVGDSDIDMGGTAAGLLDQMHTGGFSAHSTPLNNYPTPQANLSALNSNAATPANAGAPSPAPNPPANEGEPKAESAQDVAMGNTEGVVNTSSSSGAPDPNTGGEEWVMVQKEGVPHDAGAANSDTPEAKSSTPAPAPVPAPAPAAAPATAPAVAAAAASAPTPKQASAAGTPAVTEGDANDFSSLGDLDTAGDALASYGTPGLDGGAGSLGEGLDLNMDMEDSAFGDAFHGVTTNTGMPGGDNQSEDV